MAGENDPASHFSDEQIVNWLIDECRDAGGRVSTVSTSGDRILAAGSTVIALAATVAISGGKPYLLMGLPLGVTIVIAYGLYMNEMARRLVAYRSGLETEIERRVGVPVVLWSSRVNRGRYATGSIKAMLVLAATVYVAGAVIGLGQAFHTMSPGAWGHERAWLYVTATTGSVVLGLAIIAYCLWLMSVSAKEALSRVADAFVFSATESTSRKHCS